MEAVGELVALGAQGLGEQGHPGGDDHRVAVDGARTVGTFLSFDQELTAVGGARVPVRAVSASCAGSIVVAPPGGMIVAIKIAPIAR
mgnify:CR=1 FL=1